MKMNSPTAFATPHASCAKVARPRRRQILAGAIAALLGCAAGAEAAVQYWDVNGAAAGFGGTGNWDLTTPNWNTATGTAAPAGWANLADSDAVFQGTPGAVTLSVANVQARNLTFNVTGYTVAGTLAAPLNLRLGSVISVQNVADSATISAPIVTTAGFDKQGAGTLVLSGANTYSGQTSVSAGTLKAGAAAAFSATSNYFVSGTLDLGGFSNSIGSISGLAGGFVKNNGAAAAVLTTGANNLDATFQGVISDGPVGVGALGITKVGTGRQTFSGANTYSGDTLLQAGSLFSDVDPAVGTNSAFGTGTLVISGGTTLGSTLNGEVIPNGIKVLGNFTLAAGQPATNNIILKGNIDLTGSVREISGSTPNGQLNLLGAISNGGVTLTHTGASGYSSFIYGNNDALNDTANSYTGLTTLNANTFLVLNKNAGAGADAAVKGDVLVNQGGSVNYFLPDQIADTATVTVNSTGLTIAGPSAFAGFEMRNFSDTIGTLLGNGTVGLGSATLTVGAGNFSGVIQQGTIGAATGGRLTKNTAGTLTLTGANTYTGTTTLSAGVLNLGSAEIAGVSGPLGRSAAANPGSIVFGGGVLQYSAANQNDYSGRFSKTIGQAYKVDTNSQNVTFATALTSLIGTLTKSGNGTLSLAAANTYSGATTVSAGTLLVAGGIKSTVINVTGGSLVAGNATALVAGAAVAVAMGAGFEYHAVANAPLTIGALTLNSGAGTTIGGSLGSTLTGAEIVVTGNVNPTPGAIKVNVSAIPGVTTGATGTYTLLTAGAGSTLNIGTTYTLGTVAVFNNTNFTVGSPAATATTITVDIVAATPLTAAYWKGGLAGNPSVWSASNGSTASNWATNAAGTATPLVPGAGTDVFFSSTGATDPGSMTLGANMAIASLTINAATAPEVRAVKLNNDGFTLTLAGAGGITINAGAGALSLLPDLILGSSQTWTNNSGNLFTTGKVTNGASTLTVAGSSDTKITGALGSGAGGLIKTGNSTLTLTQNNPYTGGTQLLQGALVFNPTAGVPVANPFGTGTLTLAGGTRLSVAVDAQTVPNALSFIDPVSAVTIEAQTHVNFSGNGDFNGGTRTINGTVNASEIAFSGVLSNGGVTFTTSGLPAPVGGVNPYVAFLYNGAAEHAYTGLTTVQNNAFLVFQTAGEKIRGDVLIQGNGVVDYLNAQFQTLNNQLADTATVTVNSPGSTISSPNGNLTYAGLELRNNSDTIGALFGSGAGIVGLGSGALTVGRGDFSGVIRDGDFGTGGTLTKNTTGTLTLRGANTYTGNTVINNGTLVLDGSVESPAVIVNFSGTLMGTGRAAHNVLNTGIFSPGNSAGTFHIGGNFVQTGAGATVIEIGGAGAGEHDLVAVGGTAFLDGTLRLVKLGNARLKVGDKVTFLTAGSGVTGQFVKVDNPFATGTISTGAVVYGPNEVSLQIRQGSFLTLGTIIPLTLNQRAVAKELDKVLAASSEKKLIAFLNGEPLGNLPRDFDLIAAEELQSLYSIGLSQANVQTANLQRRMDDVRAGRTGFSAEGLSVSGAGEQEHAAALPASPPLAGLNGPAGPGGKEMRAPADPRFGAFITGVGEFAHIGNTAGAKGYDLATGGFTLGVDYRLTPNFTVGVNTGYARSGADLINSGRVSVDGAKLGVYATYFDEGFYVDAAVQGGYNSYDTRRSALRGPASGSTTGGEVNALIAAGFDFTSDALRIGPTASFQYTHIGFSGFRESGSLAPLQFGGQATDSTRTAIGMKAAYEFRLASGVVVRPEARLAWQHEFADAAEAIDSRLANGGGGVFTVHGVEIGRDSALLGLGVAVLWNDRTSAYLYYDGEVGRSNYQSNNVSGGMRMAF